MRIAVPAKVPSISIDDNVLIDRCRRGDSAALERLILKYQKRIYNVILRICPNPDDAAELTQETFVKVIENVEKFKGKSSFYTWAFRIAVNLTLNYCRRASKLEIRSLDSEDRDLAAKTSQQLREFLADDRAPDPAVVAQNRELCDVVSNALNRLDDGHRTVIVLRDIEGMSYTQIANVLGIELGTVRSRLSRARSHFRQIVEAIIK
ncbi:RNA polymerase sigma factor [Planctomycetota bacterium]